MKSQYTQDVEFNSGFGALQTPVHLSTAALVSGIPAPAINRPFRYLDLACGNGLTLSLLADAYPMGEFVGIDINKDHIDKAQSRAIRAGLTNVTFDVSDVADLVGVELGDFDFCVMSGAYAWLDTARRDATRKLMSSVVRPGGLVYLDYSAQPGIAQVGPLYHVLRELGATFPGTSAEKLSAAAKFADQLRGNGARFFQVQQVAAARLKTILQNPPEDEAHEVFNLQENGLWSNDVIADMEKSGFDYAANAGLHHNLATLTPGSGAQAVGDGLPVALQQMLFDVRWNVAQRRDIYVRHAEKGPIDPEALLNELPVYVLRETLETQSRRELSKHFPGYDFCSATADKFAKIAGDANKFGEIFEKLKGSGVTKEEVWVATQHFLAARLISIAAMPPAVSSDEFTDFKMGSMLNQNILIDDIGAEYSRPFASPVAGSRVLLPLKDRIYLWKLVGLDLGEAWDRLDHMKDSFRGADNEILSREGFIQTIETSLPAFRQHAVPELLRLGILRSVTLAS